ncbi:MAG: tetratricopeptide repeat protein, partial [Pseudomonadota bacterium]
QTLFEQSVSLAPEDPYCRIDFAKFWVLKAHHAQSDSSRLDHIRQARTHYVKAWKLDDTMAETYAEYADTFLFEGKRYEKAIELLEEASFLLPGNPQINARLAEAYLGIGDTSKAFQYAQAVVAWSHEHSPAHRRAQYVLEILAKVDERLSDSHN